MKMNNLKVLLLGWDNAYPTGEVATPDTLELARALAPYTQLAVLLPHLPANDADLPTEAHVTGIGNLTLAELDAADAYLPSEQLTPVAYPSFPYVGAEHTIDEVAQPFAPTTDSAPAADATATLLDADAFAATGGEPDAAEANDLDQGKEEVETAPTYAPASAERSAPSEALAVLSAHAGDSGDLNFRVIQYARFATRLALQEQFAVTYAADWPAWLAGLEIRQLTGRPLVLHVHTLAADRDTPLDRGWIMELERLALRRADLVLAATPELQQRLTADYGLPTQRVHLQPDNLADGLRQVLEEVAMATV
ncbi:glycosyltransferase [Hymenobacter sp. BT507]|uniref:Glycosyltransferase n=1 Tax=Hymenobacter citatus TaxID=2763506 RepID=A0ABR7MMA7_9BACT|nr:glycosyltransferase [Hymenobacter citatus]MBC6612206.1 glycosyltransferase [Hymenobacter citatus]